MAEAAQPVALRSPKADGKVFDIQPESFLFQRAGYGENSFSNLGDRLLDDYRGVAKGASDMPAFNHEVSLAE
jgi:hypothetical protein